jgi:DNA repair exonuclease SbcCD ATPase subunit
MKLAGKNFQPWKDFSLLIDGLTLIVGPSNKGKSSIFRALRGVFRNELPQDFVRNGQDEKMEVTLEVEGVNDPIKATRTRKGSTKYAIGEDEKGKPIEYKALGDSVPEPMKVLKYGTVKVGDTTIDPIFSQQNKAQFLIDPDAWKPNDLNAILGAFASTEKLDAGKKEANRRITEKNGEARTLAEEIREAEERRGKLERFNASAQDSAHTVSGYEAKVNSYESLLTSLIETLTRMNRIAKMRSFVLKLSVPDVSPIEKQERLARMYAEAVKILRRREVTGQVVHGIDNTIAQWDLVAKGYKRKQAVLSLLEIVERKGASPKECGEKLEGVLQEANFLLGVIAHYLSALKNINSLAEALKLPSKKSELKFTEEELDAANAKVNSLTLLLSKESKPKCPDCGTELRCPSCQPESR